MDGWCGIVNETLKALLTPSAAKVRRPRLAHNVNRHNSTKNSKLSFIPTSNHNQLHLDIKAVQVVSYLVPTSNHNQAKYAVLAAKVVSYLVPTSNHNVNQIR